MKRTILIPEKGNQNMKRMAVLTLLLLSFLSIFVFAHTNAQAQRRTLTACEKLNQRGHPTRLMRTVHVKRRNTGRRYVKQVPDARYQHVADVSAQPLAQTTNVTLVLTPYTEADALRGAPFTTQPCGQNGDYVIHGLVRQRTEITMPRPTFEAIFRLVNSEVGETGHWNDAATEQDIQAFKDAVNRSGASRFAVPIAPQFDYARGDFAYYVFQAAHSVLPCPGRPSPYCNESNKAWAKDHCEP
jgi:hypothetical protein